MSSPIADIREIVEDHESGTHDGCRCMERIGYIMQVFYPAGVEYGMMADDDYIEGDDDLTVDERSDDGDSFTTEGLHSIE